MSHESSTWPFCSPSGGCFGRKVEHEQQVLQGRHSSAAPATKTIKGMSTPEANAAMSQNGGLDGMDGFESYGEFAEPPSEAIAPPSHKRQDPSCPVPLRRCDSVSVGSVSDFSDTGAEELPEQVPSPSVSKTSHGSGFTGTTGATGTAAAAAQAAAQTAAAAVEEAPAAQEAAAAPGGTDAAPTGPTAPTAAVAVADTAAAVAAAGATGAPAATGAAVTSPAAGATAAPNAAAGTAPAAAGLGMTATGAAGTTVGLTTGRGVGKLSVAYVNGLKEKQKHAVHMQYPEVEMAIGEAIRAFDSDMEEDMVVVYTDGGITIWQRQMADGTVQIKSRTFVPHIMALLMMMILDVDIRKGWDLIFPEFKVAKKWDSNTRNEKIFSKLSVEVCRALNLFFVREFLQWRRIEFYNGMAVAILRSTDDEAYKTSKWNLTAPTRAESIFSAYVFKQANVDGVDGTYLYMTANTNPKGAVSMFQSYANEQAAKAPKEWLSRLTEACAEWKRNNPNVVPVYTCPDGTRVA